MPGTGTGGTLDHQISTLAGAIIWQTEIKHTFTQLKSGGIRMNIRHSRLVKYTALAISVYFLFLYGGTEQTDNTGRGSVTDLYVFFFLKEILNIPARRQDIEAYQQESSMTSTLASTTSSAAMFYSDEEVEEVEEVEEQIRSNMTDSDVRKETEAFLEDNKLRRTNIRFENKNQTKSKFIK